MDLCWACRGRTSSNLVETRHMHAVLSARINKTDRIDARDIAQMIRVGLFKAVHVKTPASLHRRFLLTSRKLLQKKIYDIENDLRGSLRTFGLKVGLVGSAKFGERVRELITDHPIIAAITLPLLEAHPNLRTQFQKLHKMLLDLVKADPVCQRLEWVLLWRLRFEHALIIQRGSRGQNVSVHIMG